VGGRGGGEAGQRLRRRRQGGERRAQRLPGVQPQPQRIEGGKPGGARFDRGDAGLGLFQRADPRGEPRFGTAQPGFEASRRVRDPLGARPFGRGEAFTHAAREVLGATDRFGIRGLLARRDGIEPFGQPVGAGGQALDRRPRREGGGVGQGAGEGRVGARLGRRDAAGQPLDAAFDRPQVGRSGNGREALLDARQIGRGARLKRGHPLFDRGEVRRRAAFQRGQTAFERRHIGRAPGLQRRDPGFQRGNGRRRRIRRR
jgi:hypothetical protein